MTSKVESYGLALMGVLGRLYEDKYYSQKFPSSGDEELSGLMDSLSELSQKELHELAGTLDDVQAMVLGLYSERMLSIAVRLQSTDAFKRGLLALIIYAVSQDERDVMLLLSLVVDSARRLNKNPVAFVNEICLSLGLGSIDYIKRFLARKPEDQGIDVMGYEAAYDEGGFYYNRTW